jgi:hypothetical protein
LARAGRYRLSRGDRLAFDDIVEATRNFLDADLFDEAPALAERISTWLRRSS